jgi:hypothetical protein
MANYDDLSISPEAAVIPVRGKEKNPQHTHLIEQFKSDAEVRLFAEKSRDGRTAEEWLDWWLDQDLLSLDNVSPKHAIITGSLELVMLRVRQNLRSSKRLKK